MPAEILKKMLLVALGLAVALGVAAYTAFQLSPWPSALLVRWAFDRGGWRMARALERYVPPGVSERLNERYDAADEDAVLDVFFPSRIENTEKVLPTVVWVHGGGWISGSKDQIANYARILASRGYTVAGVDYSIAPGRTYPTPVRQVNTALAYLSANAKRLHVDPSRFVLAGDSAGAHIAAQLANVIAAPSYAAAVGVVPSIRRQQLAGMILFCGVYRIAPVRPGRYFVSIGRTMPWAYSGEKDFMNDSRFATASLINYLTADFPVTFISAGNADPLLPQSRELASGLAARGVRIDSLFFPDDYAPALPHEYQFNLDIDEGRLALERAVGFLAGRGAANGAKHDLSR
jgi:acetyl esterase/lipase